MTETKEIPDVTGEKNSKAFGLVVGLALGAVLFLLTVQLLHMAK